MKHARQPRICDTCWGLLKDKARDKQEGVWMHYCPHTECLTRIRYTAGMICHTITDGPTTAKAAMAEFEQRGQLPESTSPPKTVN